MSRVRTEKRHMTLRIGIKSPTPYAWGSNSPHPERLKRSNARGMPGGRLKLRFERYIKDSYNAFESCARYPSLGLFSYASVCRKAFRNSERTNSVNSLRFEHVIITRETARSVFFAIQPLIIDHLFWFCDRISPLRSALINWICEATEIEGDFPSSYI